jgi:hypothetical protein
VKSPRRPLLLAGVLALIIATAAVTTPVVLGLDVADKASSVVGAAVALAGAIMAIVWRFANGERTEDSLAEVHAKVLANLAIVTEVQWRGEASRRRLFRPVSLPLQWSLTRSPLAASAAAVLAPAVGGRPVRWRSDVEDGRLSTLFARLPHRQLVVLGPPGSGKSTLALLFTLDLLTSRSDGDAIPVLLTATGLDLDIGLGEWVAQRLREQHPGILPADRAAAKAVVEQLLAREQLIVVLDGLDELAAEGCAAALAHLDEMFADRPYLLTCRTENYATAISRYGQPLAFAAVVEVDPVAPARALAFLRQADKQHDERWAQLTQYVRREPDGPLGRLLSLPLWLSVCRQVYGDRRRDPGHLFDRDRFTEVGRLEEFLVDELIDQAYADPQPARREKRGWREPRWRARQARRWLTFLARSSLNRSDPDLLWWKLEREVPWPALAVLYGALATTAFLGMFMIAIPSSGSAPAILAGLLGGVVGLVGTLRGRPRRIRLRLATGRARQVVPIAGAAVVFGTTMSLWTDLPVAGAIGMSACATLLAFSMESSTLSDNELRTMGPRSAMRADIRASIVLGLGAGGVMAIAIAVTFLSLGIASAPRWFQAQLLALVLAISLVAGPMLMLSRSAYARFRLASGYLALRRKLPWRAVAFLEDGCQRGVLRQHGPAYQFRHARLRDHLLGGASAPISRWR